MEDVTLKLTEYVGQELSYLARNHNVEIVKPDGKFNKGWKGHTIEAILGIPINNKPEPDTEQGELKVISYKRRKDGLLTPKDTMALTMIDCDTLRETDFFDSHLLHKIKKLIICITSWDGKYSETSRLLKVVNLDIENNVGLLSQFKSDYESIRTRLKMENYLTSSDGVYIQARTKGSGHGSTTRAFYFRTAFLKTICPPFQHDPTTQ